MKRPQTNYAFIDGTNLYLTMKKLGWKLDMQKFRIYLHDKYGIVKAYYFIGYLPEYADLYTSLQSLGYVVVFKPTLRIKGKVKGNCDAELVLQAMIDLPNYGKAVIITSDGDMACLVKYLRSQDKLLRVLAPCLKGSSHLLRLAAQTDIAFMDNLKQKLEYKGKTP